MNVTINSSSARSEGAAFYKFPLHSMHYARDIRVIMEQAIEKFGYDEWRSIVLTCEFHGHLGIYSIVGAKMGLFARDILQAGHGDVSIFSYAGYKPPISCLNDGLQVSTGATLGHGLISVDREHTGIPVVHFIHKERAVKIAIKKVTHLEIEEALKNALQDSGGMTDLYWKRTREEALLGWLKYDRNAIFEIEELKR